MIKKTFFKTCLLLSSIIVCLFSCAGATNDSSDYDSQDKEPIPLLSETKSEYLRNSLSKYFNASTDLTEYDDNNVDSLKLSVGNSTIIHKWSDMSSYNTSANSIAGSITTAQTLYFASNGDDKNSGTSPDSPKKNPTDYLRNGNATLLFKSGDIITVKYCMDVGSNIVISTYGGNERAVINAVPINSSPFQLFDANSNIYSAPIDQYTDSHYKVAWIRLIGSNEVNWHKVFSFDELKRDRDFYSDLSDKVLYMKSDTDLTGTTFAFSNSAGGFVIRDSSNCLIENLEIVGGGTGINVVNSSNVVIRDCFVHHSGGIQGVSTADGSFYRYGNGINVWTDDVKNVYIYDNYVTDCFDAGISPQISGTGTKPSDSIFIYNNYVDRCLYDIEYYEHNRSRTTPCTNVVIANNILTNALDVTGGYRYATYGYTSYFCNWSNLCDQTRFYVHNNLGYGTTEYAFAFYEDFPTETNILENNILIVMGKDDVNDCIKKPQFYTGNNSDIIPSNQLSTSHEVIEDYIRKQTSRFDKHNLFFSYLDNL